MKWYAIALIILVTIGVGGCSSPKEIVRERTLMPDQVMAAVAERNRKINTLSGEGSITIESPEHSNRGGFDLNLRKPDSVRVELSGPFGIDVGTLMLSREKFVYYNSLDNKAVIGVPDGKTLGAMFNLTMNFDEILRAFTGEFVTSGDDSLIRFGVEQGEYVIRYQSGAEQKEYHIDGDTFVVTKYRLLDATGNPRIVAMASEVEDSEVAPMPMILRVVFPAERRSITIAYDDIHVNGSVNCFYMLPKQADIIYR